MKSLLLIGALSLGTLSANAQYQLPNGDFQGDVKVVGNNKVPANWNWFDTAEGNSFLVNSAKNHSYVDVIEEGESGNKYVQVTEGSYFSQSVNGNLTTGKIVASSPVATEKAKNYNYSDPANNVGQKFSGKPDAVSFKYKVYKKGSGQAQLKIVVHGSGRYQDPESADYSNILWGTAIFQHGTTDLNKWNDGKVDFTLGEKAQSQPITPAAVLVSLSTDKNAGEGAEGDYIALDDLKFVYYSELASLTYDGKPITVQKNMDLSDQMYDENKLSCTLTGKGATVDKSFNKVTGVLTLTVKGNDWTEENPSNQNVYTIQFAKPIPSSAEVAGDYDPLLTISVFGGSLPSANDINISEKNGSAVFTMKNFNYAGLLDMGNIEVPGATLSYVDNGIKISVVNQEVELNIGPATISIDAVVDNNKELTGTVSIDYSGLPVSVSMVKCPFERELTNYTLTVKGDVTSDVAAAVVPLGKTVGLVDLTQATLGDGLNTSNFLYNPEATNNVLYKISDTQSLGGNNVIKDGVCYNFVLTDGQSFNAPEGFTANQITYNREIALSTDKDEVYTFVLPFALTADQVNGTVYDLTDVKDGVLDFKSVANLEANHPYLVVSNGTKLLNNENGELSGEISATNDLTHEIPGGVAMVGAYEATEVKSEGNENWYGYNAKGQFVKANTGTINPFRTAIKSTGSQSSFALKLDGTVTGIVNLENPNAKVDVYTIGGVCVRKNVPAASALNGLSRGVYIVGGQKVVK